MADEKVLAAQKWANATYSGVSGYNKCPEDGRTGWSTMFSLTRALQHELGIGTLSDSFGPTTLSKLAARGDIGSKEPNANIRKIVQHALFCKGYWGGDGEGTYDAQTSQAVAKLKIDAGLDATNGMVQPKLFKALLNMDAYVLLAGGNEQVRSIQQWLNGRYFNKSTFYVVPTDGHYTRDVQTALMKALQYECGVPEDQATGNFGPATQQGLRDHLLVQGSTGVFVQLFSAACVFNGTVDDTTTSFKNSFDDKLTTFVKAFQSFSALTVNGLGDYPTWCQLLVSTGDPERPGTACDTSRTITPARAKDLYAAGYRVIGRYLDEDPEYNTEKPLKPSELDALFGAGMKIFPISQYTGRELSAFTYTTGYQHGLKAHEKASGHGFNRGTVIYFAVDYDATSEQIESNIIPYFRGIVAALASQGRRYLHGVYGSRNVCSMVTNATDARWSFVSGMSWGFSGNLGFPMPTNWSYTQIKEFDFTGPAGNFPLDKDVWRPRSDAASSTVSEHGSPTDKFFSFIGQIQSMAYTYGGKDQQELVMEYMRAADYNNSQWKQLIGAADQGFVDYVANQGVKRMAEFVDPSIGLDLFAPHLFAAANGHLVKGNPSGKSINRGDVAGWGGDIITFYAEWRRDSDSNASGYTYAKERLGRANVSSTFGLGDLCEDADGFNIAMAVKGGLSVEQAVKDYYTTGELTDGGFLRRFRNYYDNRFKGNGTDAVDIIRNMLTSEDDPVISLGRVYLIEKQIEGGAKLLPSMMPADRLTEFCRGFADVLLEKVGTENARMKKLLAEQRTKTS